MFVKDLFIEEPFALNYLFIFVIMKKTAICSSV